MSRSFDHDGIDLNVNPSDNEFEGESSDSGSDDGTSTDSEEPHSETEDQGENLRNDNLISVDGHAGINLTEDHGQLEQLIRNNEQVKQIVKETVADEVKEQVSTKKAKKGNGRPLPRLTEPVPIGTGKDNQGKQSHEMVIFEETSRTSRGKNANKEVELAAKSPSDTTLYTPALKKAKDSNEMLNKITNFVDSIRIESTGAAQVSPGRAPPPVAAEGRPSLTVNDDRLGTSTHEKTEQRIIQAEQFRANIVAPKGRNLMGDDNDDDFFHITCHIEQGFRENIQNGDFIDLERLLPKERRNSLNEEQRLEWVSREGATFFAPAQDKSAKINSLCKWEQAF